MSDTTFGGSTLRVLVIVLIAVGAISRLAPFADQDARLLQQFPTEDGYLMLTIARNVALGHGMSIADGEIATNGTQPLATYLWAACFKAMGGAKRAGVACILGLEFLIAAWAAWLLFQLGKVVLRSSSAAALAAAAWYASPMTVRHSMNCLETGLYAGVVIAVALLVVRGRQGSSERPAFSAWLGMGLLLGTAFWSRNDGVLLCLAVGVLHLLNWLAPWRGSFFQRFVELALAASVTALVAAPWLIQNYLGFGSIMPISGHAEAMGAGFGENFLQLPIKLFEYLTLYLPIPLSVEEHLGVILVCAGVVLAALLLMLRLSRGWSDVQRSVFWVGGTYALLLSAFYGLSFGAGHFMSRYMFPASPFLALFWAATVFWGVRFVAQRVGAAGALAAVGIVVLALGLNLRMYRNGAAHMHFQVKHWVEANVPEEVWVGAIQTGTLGFFHDRTINLDGKVNPEALAARREERLLEYVVERDIQYLVDWVGIAEWAQRPELASHFEVVVQDTQRNLGVLQRQGAPRLQP